MKLYIKTQNLLQSLKDESGQDMIEYALVLGIIAVGAVASLSTIAGNVTTAYAALSTSLAAAL
jgi:pilus assembly protein Flp/PilA